MKTKQVKEELDKSNEDDTTIEPKTRARKKASDIAEEEKSKPNPEEPKPSKEPRKNVAKPKAVVKKKPLGIRKTLRSKKALAKDKIKNAVTHAVTRARKAAIKTEPENSQEKETVPLIPASEIKKEPIDDTSPGSRSSSPKTAGRRQRLSSDIIMMKSVLGDSPSSLVLGPRTSPYSMRSERSNSPSLSEGKGLRTLKPRKAKSNLLNEVVMKEQNKKRRRLLSESKTSEAADTSEECKKLKRGRSSSRDGSEISKCSDVTESDLSLSESLNDTDNKELNKKLDKSKTELEIDIQNNVQISTVEKVPSLNVDSKLETKPGVDTSSTVNDKNKKKKSLQRSTSLDSDNNNSNRLKLESLHSSDVEDKSSMKTENDTLFAARSSILTSMSKTFNSKEVSKNIRKARRGRKAAAAPRRPSASPAVKTEVSAPVVSEPVEEKQETLESLSKEIDDLINNLDQNIDHDDSKTDKADTQSKTPSKFYSLSKPLGDNNSIMTPETPVKDSQLSLIDVSTPSKTDDSENIRLHYEEDSHDNTHDGSKQDKTFKCSTVASIDLLMDRLKEFEEFDKRRQRQESESKSGESKSVMVSNDVVLIPKSGADIKLKDIQTVKSPERPVEKENVLSCFEYNSAISIVKREPARKSIDIDLPSSVTLIKRNSISARKESTSSNHSRESDAISIFEKSLGKDVTLTEIRKSVDKQPTSSVPSVDLHQLATLLPNNPTQSIAGMSLDPNQISIMPRLISETKISSSEVQLTKRISRDSLSRKSSEPGIDSEEKMATIEKIRSPLHQVLSPAISITPSPVAVKSPESMQPMDTEASAPPLDSVKVIPDDITLTSDISKVAEASVPILNDTTKKVAIESSDTQVLQVVEESKTENISAIVPTVPTTETAATVEKLESLKPNTRPTEESMEIDVKPYETERSAKVSEVKEAEATETKQLLKAESIMPEIEESKKSEIEETKKLEIEETKKSEKEETKKSEIEEIQKSQIKETKKSEIGETKKSEIKEIIKSDIEETKKSEIAETKKLEIGETKKSGAEEIKKLETVEPKKSDVAEKVRSTRGSKSARNSLENQPGPSNLLQETPESQKRKENVLRTLGLLTHKAANEAKIEKAKEKERLYNGLMSNKKQAVKSGDYTGTLKTVIKLNRGTGDRDKKRQRSSLKMTFQKSKNRAGKPQLEAGEETRDDDAYYTIERREGGSGAGSDGGHRKSHYSNRLNNYDGEAAPEPVEPKETLNLVIPEKASSFSIHPGRLCMDQCFYCGGKFGLFDTPCHIAAMKSAERQKKVLDNEEKLTVDSCLCDACYRHVDRRANCPSYRKRPALKQPHSLGQPLPPANNMQQSDKPPSPVDEESSEECGEKVGAGARCHTAGCGVPATHSIRRKWLIKMRSSVNKILRLEGDYPGLHTIPLCGEHHRLLAPLTACRLCRRRLTKHHNVHFLHSYDEINPLLTRAGIPVQFTERPVLCKMCRYYCTLLARARPTGDKYAKQHRRKLLQIYNIEVPPESDHEAEEPSTQEDLNNSTNKQKKKMRTKSKQRKSSEPEKPGECESSEKTSESSSPEKDKPQEPELQPQHTTAPKPAPPPETRQDEEDIESLISSNKILVPGAKIPDPPQTNENSEDVYEFESVLPIDKQTELQYLLQKQNNPAQFLHKTPNLTQKVKNISKIQSTGIQKTGQQQRINEKNAKRIQKMGQMVLQNQKEKSATKEDIEMSDVDKPKEILPVPALKNIPLSDECTIESISNKRPADITTLKSKWQMSESFTQVKRNLSELSKKFSVEKDPKKPTEVKYFNPVKRLETNPSISVRELFPGEEEMNLQCNIEFNSVKGVTPEGWEKCNSVIQYDLETKKLWTELQRPYGNQSSFLRHLILLEKYFRSGDLVLSHNASPHAAMYSDSVQSRLRAYDNIASDAPRRSEPAINLIEFRKKPSTATNGKSLLKTNQSDVDKDLKKTMPPPGSVPKKPAKEKGKVKPPELIAINTPTPQGRKSIQNVLHNIQQLVKGVTAADPTQVAAAPLPMEPSRLEPPRLEPPRPEPPRLEPPRLEPPRLDTPKEKKDPPPKPETPKVKKPTSKPWRPTLMPITPENLARIAREPTQVAIDGRHLPSLVQVMSSGKRYHITLQDYNKMCIMRQEKLQQLQEGEKEKTKKPEESSVVTEIQPSPMLGNGGTLVQNISQEKEPEKKEMPELSRISSNAATILKNVGLKNITIAPIPPKTATVTSQTTAVPIVSSPSLLVTSTGMKLPQFGPAVSITSETVLSPALPVVSSVGVELSSVMMPKIPKSLTVIPQSAVISQSSVLPSVMSSVMPAMLLPQNVMLPPGMIVPQTSGAPVSVPTSDGPRP